MSPETGGCLLEIFNQSGVPQRLLRFLLDTLVKGVCRTFAQMKKVRHYLRPPGRHCLRTRAHGRRRLVACRWRSRRRRRRSLRSSSMWSATGGGGTRRCSGSAGGSLRLMALSSATPSCGLCGTLVDVTVTMLDKFHQSLSYVFVSVPRQSVGHLVGDAQCTLCTGPWGSTGPVSWCGVECALLCNNRCRGRLCSRMLGSTVDTFSASLLGALWTNFTYFLREGGTQILKCELENFAQ